MLKMQTTQQYRQHNTIQTTVFTFVSSGNTDFCCCVVCIVLCCLYCVVLSVLCCLYCVVLSGTKLCYLYLQHVFQMLVLCFLELQGVELSGPPWGNMNTQRAKHSFHYIIGFISKKKSPQPNVFR